MVCWCAWLEKKNHVSKCNKWFCCFSFNIYLQNATLLLSIKYDKADYQRYYFPVDVLLISNYISCGENTFNIIIIKTFKNFLLQSWYKHLFTLIKNKFWNIKCAAIQNPYKIILCVLLRWRRSIPTPTQHLPVVDPMFQISILCLLLTFI